MFAEPALIEAVNTITTAIPAAAVTMPQAATESLQAAGVLDRASTFIDDYIGLFRVVSIAIGLTVAAYIVWRDKTVPSIIIAIVAGALVAAIPDLIVSFGGDVTDEFTGPTGGQPAAIEQVIPDAGPGDLS